MNKYVVIGDIHGRKIWEDIVKENKDAHKIIILGDYFDHYYHDTDVNGDIIKYLYRDTRNNFLRLLKLKKNNPDQVVLLLGNHDIHYAYNFNGCSRYDQKNDKKIKKLFQDNIECFQFAYQVENHLFTHAGVSSEWFNWSKRYLIENGLKEDLSNLADIFNIVGKNDKEEFLHSISFFRGGELLYGGITWADMSELTNTLDNFHQYVGHNKVKYIDKIEKENKSITFCDVLHTPNPILKYNYLILKI